MESTRKTGTQRAPNETHLSKKWFMVPVFHIVYFVSPVGSFGRRGNEGCGRDGAGNSSFFVVDACYGGEAHWAAAKICFQFVLMECVFHVRYVSARISRFGCLFDAGT